MSSHRRKNVLGQVEVGDGSGSVCLSEELPGFLLRSDGRSGLRAPELLDRSAKAGSPFSPKSKSDNEYGDNGNAGLSSEILVPGSSAEALQLRRVLSVDSKEAISNGVK